MLSAQQPYSSRTLLDFIGSGLAAPAFQLWTRPLAKYTRLASLERLSGLLIFGQKCIRIAPLLCDSFLWHHFYFRKSMSENWKFRWMKEKISMRNKKLASVGEKIPRFTTVSCAALCCTTSPERFIALVALPSLRSDHLCWAFFLVDHNWGGAHQQEKKR